MQLELITNPRIEEDEIIAKAKQILSKRYEIGVKIDSPRVIRDHLQFNYGAATREQFGVVFMSTNNTIISEEILFQGTLNMCAVYPREIASRALALSANAVILFHNHPSGNLEESDADIKITKAISKALSLIDVSVLDHIIVTPTGSMSFAEKGQL